MHGWGRGCAGVIAPRPVVSQNIDRAPGLLHAVCQQEATIENTGKFTFEVRIADALSMYNSADCGAADTGYPPVGCRTLTPPHQARRLAMAVRGGNLQPGWVKPLQVAVVRV